MKELIKENASIQAPGRGRQAVYAYRGDLRLVSWKVERAPKIRPEIRKYRPDFIVQVDDGKGAEDPLNLIVEIKGYRGEDAKEKKGTMDTYWVTGVNNLKQYGRWDFAEFTDVYQMQDDFTRKV
jgi:hypothetical protein